MKLFRFGFLFFLFVFLVTIPASADPSAEKGTVTGIVLKVQAPSGQVLQGAVIDGSDDRGLKVKVADLPDWLRFHPAIVAPGRTVEVSVFREEEHQIEAGVDGALLGVFTLAPGSKSIRIEVDGHTFHLGAEVRNVPRSQLGQRPAGDVAQKPAANECCVTCGTEKACGCSVCASCGDCCMPGCICLDCDA